MKRYIKLGKDFAISLNQKNINVYAASTAFFLFLSLIPMLILMCAILPYTPLTEADLMMGVTELTPGAMHPLIVSVINDVYRTSSGVVSIAIIATLWSAGKGVLALMRGLNAINGVVEIHSALVQRLVASLYTVIVLVVLILSLIIMVFGNVLIILLVKNIPQLSPIFSFLVYFRYVILWALFSLGLALIYAYIPGIRTKLWMQLPGAALAAWTWSLTSYFFSIYVEDYNGFNTYGSLTTIVMIMIWLYIGVYVIMLGAYVNKYFRPLYLYMAERKQLEALEKKLGSRKEQ